MAVDGVFTNISAVPEVPPKYSPRTVSLSGEVTAAGEGPGASLEVLPSYSEVTKPTPYWLAWTIYSGSIIFTSLLGLSFTPLIIPFLVFSILFKNRFCLFGALGGSGLYYAIYGIIILSRTGTSEYTSFMFYFTSILGGMIIFKFSLLSIAFYRSGLGPLSNSDASLSA